MPDHDWNEPRDPLVPGELFRSTASPASLDLTAALGGLDRATRNFTRRLGERSPQADGPAASESPRRSAPPPVRPRPDPPAPEPQPPAQPPRLASQASFDHRFRDAEREAREYLESAKRRADSLVASMVGAVEHEAAEIRRDAEESIRARWQQVQIDASRQVEDARHVAEQMVAERQERLAALSDEITGRAHALTAGMDDADRVRGQFEAFVRALAATADQIAQEQDRAGAPAEVRDLHDRPRPSVIAA